MNRENTERLAHAMYTHTGKIQVIIKKKLCYDFMDKDEAIKQGIKYEYEVGV